MVALTLTCAGLIGIGRQIARLSTIDLDWQTVPERLSFAWESLFFAYGALKTDRELTTGRQAPPPARL